MKFFQEAFKYAGRGLKVFPLHSITEQGSCTCGNASCKSAGKHPKTSDGHLCATDNHNQINEWLTDMPDSNIGIACELSGIVVLDIDTHEGKDNGLELLKELEEKLEPLPKTPIVTTGGGGRHYWFKNPGINHTSKRHTLLVLRSYCTL